MSWVIFDVNYIIHQRFSCEIIQPLHLFRVRNGHFASQIYTRATLTRTSRNHDNGNTALKIDIISVQLWEYLRAVLLEES